MGLVEIAGRADSVGRPLLYHTTSEFMDKFGLASIDDLPTLREIEELMDDPAYSKEHAQLLFREGLGLDAPSDDDEDSGREERPQIDVEGDGAVGPNDDVVLGGDDHSG